MDENPNKDIAFAALRLPPAVALDRRNKFDVGIVPIGSNGHRFLRVARYDKEPLSSLDLSNEVNWNRDARRPLERAGFRVPDNIVYNPKTKWALFEFMNGVSCNEAQMRVHIDEIARLCAEISKIPLKKIPNGVASWFHKRVCDAFNNFLGVYSSRSEELSKVIDKIDPKEGFVHGDFKIDNLLFDPDNRNPFAIVDAEFGTNLDRPDRCLPRYLDAAYFYHLLHCQFHDPDLAEEFKDAFIKHLGISDSIELAAFEQEFTLTVLERTVSMGRHFIWERDPSKLVDDSRRLEPVNYEKLIDSALVALTI
ncbi:MAG: hypothetical protein U0R17_00745 [Acidimicrobiia bacterium]